MAYDLARCVICEEYLQIQQNDVIPLARHGAGAVTMIYFRIERVRGLKMSAPVINPLVSILLP